MNNNYRQLICIAKQLDKIEGGNINRNAGFMDTLKNLKDNFVDAFNDAKALGDKQERQRKIDQLSFLVGELKTMANKSEELLLYIILGNTSQIDKYKPEIDDKDVEASLNQIFANLYDHFKKNGATEQVKKLKITDPKKLREFFEQKGVLANFEKQAKELNKGLNALNNSLLNKLKEMRKQNQESEGGFDWSKIFDIG